MDGSKGRVVLQFGARMGRLLRGTGRWSEPICAFSGRISSNIVVSFRGAINCGKIWRRYSWISVYRQSSQRADKSLSISVLA